MGFGLLIAILTGIAFIWFVIPLFIGSSRVTSPQFFVKDSVIIGSKVVIYSNFQIKIQDLEYDKEPIFLRFPDIEHLEPFMGDKFLLIYNKNNTLGVFDFNNFKKPKEINQDVFYALPLKTAKVLILMSSGQALLYDSNFNVLQEYVLPVAPEFPFDFHEEGELLVIGRGEFIYYISSRTFAILHTVKLPITVERLTQYENKTFLLNDSQTQSELFVIDTSDFSTERFLFNCYINSLVSKDDTIYLGSEEGTLYKIEGGVTSELPMSHSTMVYDMLVIDSGLLSCSEGEIIEQTEHNTLCIKTDFVPIQMHQFSSHEVVIVGSNGGIYKYNLTNHKLY